MTKPFTIKDFLKAFPDDESCLVHLFKVRYGDNPKCPKCGKVGTFHRLAKLPAWSCNCGHHLHPMAGTPFERTRTPLQKWFYVMFMFTTTRNGVSAKEIQRQIGCTYKTAWRMGHEIRMYIGWVDGDGPLGGNSSVVEVDKAYIGGKDKQGEDDKAIVLGMVERDGEVVTRVVRSRREKDVMPHVAKIVRPGTTLSTDEGRTFVDARRYGFNHVSVNHAKKEWVNGAAHTNTIEAFWGWVKRGINGTHVWVSPKHLPKYLAEFEFRFNLRKSPHLMFDVLLAAFPRP